MARPPGSRLCLLLLLSQILPPTVAMERGLSEDQLHQGTEGWISGKDLKANGTWERGHSRATASRTPIAADGLEKVWGLPGKRAVSSDRRDKSTKGDYSDSNTTSSTAKDSWSQANTGSIVGHGSGENISISPTSTATTERTSSVTPSNPMTPTSTVTTERTISATLSTPTTPTSTATTERTSSATPSNPMTPTSTVTTERTISATLSTPTTPTSTVTTERTSSTPSASTSSTPTHKTTYLASSTSETKVTPSAAPTTTRNPCQNNGKWNGTHCRCPYGFEGERCEKKVQENPFCENGGFWIDGQCVCPSPYTGPRCKDIISNIELPRPEIVEAHVEVTLKVQETFTEELKDKSSEEFRKFNETFTKQMHVIYKEIPGYKGVRILQLSQGSVVVEHEVLIEIDFKDDLKEVLKNLTETVKETITASAGTTCAGDKLCFTEDGLKVNQSVKVNYDPDNKCKKMVGADLAEFFYAEYKDQKLSCVNLCTPGFSREVNCNLGMCVLERRGPRCYCMDTDTHWYSGAACEIPNSKMLVYGLVTAVVLSVLVSVIMLVSFELHFQREAKRDHCWKGLGDSYVVPESETESEGKPYASDFIEDVNPDFSPLKTLTRGTKKIMSPIGENLQEESGPHGTLPERGHSRWK